MDRPQPGSDDPSPNPLAVARLPLARLSLLGLLILAVPAAFAIGVDGDMGLEMLRRHQLDLLRFVVGEPILAALGFMAVYAVAVATSLPGMALLVMLGGFLFGWVQGTIYVLLAGTISSVAMFVFARGALAEAIRARAGTAVGRFADGFRRHALTFVFILHLVPIFPYGMMIALPAACGVRLPSFLLGAVLGVLPGTVLLAHLGAGFGHILRGTGPIELSSFLTPQILLALAGLILLSLIPLGFRKVMRRRPAD